MIRTRASRFTTLLGVSSIGLAWESARAAGVSDAAALNNNAGDLFGRIWPYLLGLLVLAVVGGLFAMWLRRRLSSAEEGVTPGFSLEDLRQMHRRGEMSDEEFAKAKGAMLAKRPSREEMADKLVVRKQPKRGAKAPDQRPPRGPAPE